MKSNHQQSHESIPEKWSPRGKNLRFYLHTYMVAGRITDIAQFTFSDLEIVYARLGPKRIRRWRDADIHPQTILPCFNDPISLRQFKDCRKALDAVAEADLEQIGVKLGLKTTKGNRKPIQSPSEYCSDTLVRFYLKYEMKEYPVEDVIWWCVYEMYSFDALWELHPFCCEYCYPNEQIAGWMDSGFTHEQVSELLRQGHSFARPEEAIRTWRIYEKQGYSWQEFLISRDIISQFKGEANKPS